MRFFGSIGSIVVSDDVPLRQSLELEPLAELRIELDGTDEVLAQRWSWNVLTRNGAEKSVCRVVKQDVRTLWVYGAPGSLRLRARNRQFGAREFDIDLPSGRSDASIAIDFPARCTLRATASGKPLNIPNSTWYGLQLIDGAGERVYSTITCLEVDRVSRSAAAAFLYMDDPGDFTLRLPTGAEGEFTEYQHITLGPTGPEHELVIN